MLPNGTPMLPILRVQKRRLQRRREKRRDIRKDRAFLSRFSVTKSSINLASYTVKFVFKKLPNVAEGGHWPGFATFAQMFAKAFFPKYIYPLYTAQSTLASFSKVASASFVLPSASRSAQARRSAGAVATRRSQSVQAREAVEAGVYSRSTFPRPPFGPLYLNLRHI